jgi:hypothetical protein
MCGILTVAFLIGNAAAESSPIVYEKWKFEFGGFSQDAKMKISAAAAGEVPDIIDLNSLGVDDKDQGSVWLAGRWRINERWHVGLSFVEVDRSGFASSTEDFEFGEPPDEVNVTIGASVNSNFNTKYFIVQGGYSLVSSDRGNFGVGAGLHVMDFTASVSAEVTVDGTTTNLGTGESSSTAPLPNIYLYGSYAFTPSFAATGNIGWFGLEVDKYDGRLLSANANLEYRPWTNFGIGIGYTQVNVDLTINETDSVVNFEIDTSGPRLYVIASFGSVR